jgi:hypothetical protein
VSHLVKIHGKAELLQSQQQQISSRQTIWRRKRKACELNSTDSNLEANPDHEVSFQDVDLAVTKMRVIQIMIVDQQVQLILFQTFSVFKTNQK